MKSIKATVTSACALAIGNTMAIIRNCNLLILLACLLGFQFQGRAQTNVYTMPPAEVHGASATAFIIGGVFNSIFLDDGGKGFTSPPNVSIVLTEGSGSGAVVVATVANGSVTGFTIQNPNSYSTLAKCK